MQCNYCQWQCDVTDTTFGVCRMYKKQGGEIVERFPGLWCTYSISKIESIPFYHAYPGSRTMTIGTAGCNFSCRYCSNAFIAKEEPEIVRERMFELTPAQLVGKAVQLGCHNIVFNVNEPTVSLPSLVAVAEEAKKADIAMGCLTNGYTTEWSTKIMGAVFSFMNIGLKGFTKSFHRKYIGIPDPEPILRNIRTLAKTNHVEVITPVIQDVNDGDLNDIADFLGDVDPRIPWHVFRLLPEDEMKTARYPDIEKIDRALEKARKKLSFVYFHNFVGSRWVNTRCPACGHIAIERFSLGCGGDRLSRFDCHENRCLQCGSPIHIHGEKMQWNSREVGQWTE